MADGRVVIDTEIDSSGAEKDMNKLGSTLKKVGATTAKGLVAGVGAATTAVVALTKSAVDSYAEYEQLVGGVDTLFGKASKEVQKYAENAYKKRLPKKRDNISRRKERRKKRTLRF